MSAQEVVLRVPALQANYLRTLPLHESQEELDRNEHSSTFHYRLKITPDFEQEVYALGYWQAEVLSPQTLRDAVAERLSRSLACYGTAGLSCMNTGSRRYFIFSFHRRKERTRKCSRFL